MSNNKQNSIEKMFQEMLGIQQEGIKLTFDENLALLEKYKAMHKEEHGKTWDDSLDRLDARGGVSSRAWVDFDDYYKERFQK